MKDYDFERLKDAITTKSYSLLFLEDLTDSQLEQLIEYKNFQDKKTNPVNITEVILFNLGPNIKGFLKHYSPTIRKFVIFSKKDFVYEEAINFAGSICGEGLRSIPPNTDPLLEKILLEQFEKPEYRDKPIVYYNENDVLDLNQVSSRGVELLFSAIEQRKANFSVLTTQLHNFTNKLKSYELLKSLYQEYDLPNSLEVILDTGLVRLFNDNLSQQESPIRYKYKP